ncbi:hypothetical protein RCL_jg8226.t1 [Rhizophagus clarus]|uniref:Uncharacterized protein n=1 Tax=Rhizophagus clarus TaxID=94130 RepID=A0A8H3MBT6_9GLOM|nr:hypothetical protein RCL_jg8226.t1 [Rhizophagus clarus]
MFCTSWNDIPKICMKASLFKNELASIDVQLSYCMMNMMLLLKNFRKHIVLQHQHFSRFIWRHFGMIFWYGSIVSLRGNLSMFSDNEMKVLSF